jgi:hypothetical protein
VQKLDFPVFNLVIACSMLSLVACGGGGGGGDDGGGASINIQQGFGANDTSSHALKTAAIYINRQAIRTINSGTFVHAVSYVDFDFDGDGFKDIVVDDAARNIVWFNHGSGNFQAR